MKKLMLYSIVIFCAFIADNAAAQFFSATSDLFEYDSRVPNISNWCPEAGTIYLPGQEVYLDYSLFEGNLTSLQLGFSSEINGEITILGNLPPEGQAFITIPDVVTSFGRLYIIASDSFGHINNYEVPSDGYLTIGTGIQPVSLIPGWSGISTYYVPVDNQIANIFSDHIEDIVIIQDLQDVFWPGGNLFSLNEWDVMQGYVIKTLNPFTVNFQGSTPQCNEWANIDEGWDIIPIIADCDIEAQSFMSWYLWSSVIIKEVAGWRVLWPTYNINSLQVLERGKSYFVYSWMANNDFWFGPCWEGEKMSFDSKPAIPKKWNQPISTAVSHVFAIPEEVLLASDIESDFTIGAFTPEGLCIGTAPAGAFHITVFADDPTTQEIDGIATGETVHFRAWSKSKTREFILFPTFDHPDEGIFSPNGLSVIRSLTASATSIDELTGHIPAFFPNPADDFFSIKTSFTGEYLVSVSDVRGSLLLTQNANGDATVKISNLPQGVYFVNLSNADISITRKLIKR